MPAYSGQYEENTSSYKIRAGIEGLSLDRRWRSRSIIEATLTSLRVEEEERLVSEEQSDEFQVFPEMRRRAERIRT